MTATYNADNTLIEQPDLDLPPDKPIEKNYYGNVIRFHVDLYNWEKVMDAYNANAQKIAAVCRTIPCSPECRGLWKEGQVLEEGKDYEVTGGTNLVSRKSYWIAIPLPVKREQDEDDLWKEAAHMMAEKNSPGLTRENTIYRQRWTEYHKGLMKLKELGYTLIIKP